jgi:hypothetical protein
MMSVQKMTFVFMQTGLNNYTHLMVASIKKVFPQSVIIQCSNKGTKPIAGISSLFVVDSDESKLMRFRIDAFTRLGLKTPAIYIDTDMLFINTFNIENSLFGNDAVVCRRSFDRDRVFNHKFKGLNFSEYESMSMDDVYPFLACFTITRNFEFWEKCSLHLKNIDEKFLSWYGDQECLKNITSNSNFKISYIDESECACLPEYSNLFDSPISYHFKGPSRKQMMLDFARQLMIN